MILIIGGAYQGKLTFAKDALGVTDADVHICGSGEIDFAKRCIYKIETIYGVMLDAAGTGNLDRISASENA